MKNRRTPTKITLDAYAASHCAAREMKETGELPRRVKVRSSQYLNTADLINMVVERLRTDHCELLAFETLNRLVHRVRSVIHQRIFRRVLTQLGKRKCTGWMTC
jgi:hypothetical protein